MCLAELPFNDIISVIDVTYIVHNCEVSSQVCCWLWYSTLNLPWGEGFVVGVRPSQRNPVLALHLSQGLLKLISYITRPYINNGGIGWEDYISRSTKINMPCTHMRQQDLQYNSVSYEQILIPLLLLLLLQPDDHQWDERTQHLPSVDKVINSAPKQVKGLHLYTLTRRWLNCPMTEDLSFGEPQVNKSR